MLLLRSARPEDAQEVLRIYELVRGQTEYLLSYPGESTMTFDEERGFLEGREASPNALFLCAFLDGTLVGTAGIAAVGSYQKLRHRAQMDVAIDRACWGRGIGRAMVQACLECAREAQYLQVELSVVEENRRAVELYRRFGFEQFGRNPCGLRTRDGRWQTVADMRMELK